MARGTDGRSQMMMMIHDDANRLNAAAVFCFLTPENGFVAT